MEKLFSKQKNKDPVLTIKNLIHVDSDSKIVELDPPRSLKFNAKICHLKIKNISKNNIIFKVKTTKPDNYIVVPNCGQIKVNEIQEVQIKLSKTCKEFPSDFVCKDKFLIESCCIKSNALPPFTIENSSKIRKLILDLFLEIDKLKKINESEVNKYLRKSYIITGTETSEPSTTKIPITFSNPTDNIIVVNSEIFELDSPDKLIFHMPFDVPKICTIKIKNISENNLIFKIKTTAPSNYIVVPNCGEIKVNEEQEVQIKRTITHEKFPSDFVCKDKFLIKAMCIDECELSKYRESYQTLKEYILTKFIEIEKLQKNDSNSVKHLLHSKYKQCVYLQPESKLHKIQKIMKLSRMKIKI